MERGFLPNAPEAALMKMQSQTLWSAVRPTVGGLPVKCPAHRSLERLWKD